MQLTIMAILFFLSIPAQGVPYNTFTLRVDMLTMGERQVAPDTTVEQKLAILEDDFDIALVYFGNDQRTISSGEILQLHTKTIGHETTITPIPYGTYAFLSPNLWEGERITSQVGIPGELETTYEVVFIGGMPTTRRAIASTTTTEPVHVVDHVGIGQLGTLADPTVPYFAYTRRVRMEATAYTAGFCCTGKRPGHPLYRITASGMEVTHGVVAVDRNLIPLGTRLYVEGHGFAIAADVGGAIRGYKIDLFMECLQAALQFGRRHLYVWIL